MNKALFLDRDGVLNNVVVRGALVSSPRSLDEFEIIPESSKLVRAAREKKYIIVVVTNQPDSARGILPREELGKMHEVLRSRLPIDDLEICDSADDTDYRRKPNPGMIVDATKKHDIDLNRSWLVGDSMKDIVAGRRAGVRAILLQTSYNEGIHGSGDYNCNSFNEIIDLL